MRDAGDFAAARQMLSQLTGSAPADSWLAKLELADILDEAPQVKQLLDGGMPELDSDGKRIAFLHASRTQPRHSVVEALSGELCAPPPGAVDPALDTACASHSVVSKTEPTECTSGCEQQTWELYPGAYPIVFVSINGSEPMPMGVFGSGPSSLTSAAIAKLGLERVGEPFSLDSSGQPVSSSHVVADVQIGETSWKRVVFAELAAADDFIVGGISPDDLLNGPFELDLSALELRVGGTPTRGLSEVPMARVDGAYAAWGKVGDRPLRPFVVSIGNSAFIMSDAYHASGTEFPIAETVQNACAGGVTCERRMIRPFHSPLKFGEHELEYSYALMDAPASPTEQLDASGYAGAVPYRGRILRFDNAAHTFGLSEIRLPELSKGDRAAFSISGSRVARPATLYETIIDARDDFVDIGQIFESADAHEQFRIQVSETHGARGGWLHTRRPLSTFAAHPDFGTKQISTDDYSTALTPYATRFRGGPTLHIAPVKWTIDSQSYRCLEMRSQAQVGPEEFGLMEAVQCPTAKWRTVLVRLLSGEDVLFELRRENATGQEGAVVR